MITTVTKAILFGDVRALLTPHPNKRLVQYDAGKGSNSINREIYPNRHDHPRANNTCKEWVEIHRQNSIVYIFSIYSRMAVK